MAKDRGVKHMKKYFGDFLEVIEDRIKKKGKVRILDAGCGHGVAMIGLVKRFGENVEVTGFNYSPEHGNLKRMKKQAIKKGIFTEEEFRKIKNIPKFLYIDASKKLPFSSNSFDFIYSMASVYLYDDKVHFLEECNRILKKGGIARISAAFWPHFKDKKGFPSRYYEMWEIWDKGKEVKIWDYCKRIKGIKLVGKGKNTKQYLEIRKQPRLDFKLQFVSSIDYNFLWEDWAGIKSIYTTQKKFEPHWKTK